jgi:hypothetical protein
MADLNDKSADNPVGLTNPLTGPYCVKVKSGVKVNINGTNSLGGPMIVGGVVDDGVKFYDALSPIQPTCAEQFEVGANPTCNNGATGGCITAATCVKADFAKPCCFDPNNMGGNCYTAGCWSMLPGVYPFYDNSNATTNYGAVWVVP